MMRLLGHGKVQKKGSALSLKSASLTRESMAERKRPRFCWAKERMTCLISVILVLILEARCHPSIPLLIVIAVVVVVAAARAVAVAVTVAVAATDAQQDITMVLSVAVFLI